MLKKRLKNQLFLFQLNNFNIKTVNKMIECLNNIIFFSNWSILQNTHQAKLIQYIYFFYLIIMNKCISIISICLINKLFNFNIYIHKKFK